MSSAEQKTTAKPIGVGNLQTQPVDMVASILMAALVNFGFIVLLLFVLWLTQTFQRGPSGIEVLRENAAGRGDHAEGFERDIEPPGADEVEELTEPTLAETLQAVTDAASSVAASVDSIASDSSASTHGGGMGDSRPPGPLGEGDDIIPRFERWELKFLAKDQRSYAAQLDFYQIELACIGGGNSQVEYASNLAASPTKRSGTSVAENKTGRIYFMWRANNPLMLFEQALLQQAGISTRGRQMLKFIPKELENLLANIELDYAKSKGHPVVTEIAKTIFESRANDSGGYTFTVIDQRYRQPKRK